MLLKFEHIIRLLDREEVRSLFTNRFKSRKYMFLRISCVGNGTLELYIFRIPQLVSRLCDMPKEIKIKNKKFTPNMTRIHLYYSRSTL